MANKSNFTPAEMDLLNKLVNKYRPIIECKITNMVFNKKKDQAWNNLAREFNASPGVLERSAKQLRNKYKNLKSSAQRKRNDNKTVVFMTEEETQNLLSSATDVQLVSLDVSEENESSNDCNGFYEPSVELAEDTSNDENTDSECAVSGEIVHLNETIPETPVGVDDQDTVGANSSTFAKKEPESTTFVPRKKKLNISTEGTDIVTEIAKARRIAIEEENKLFLEFKRTEHMAHMVSLKKDDEYKKLQHEMLMQEHKVKMQLLSAKLEHYKLLNAQIKQSMKAMK